MAMTKQERAERKAERAASVERIRAAQAETQRIVDSRVCPKCGCDLRLNTSITGWWQCEQYGAPGFRARATVPPCNWQGFTS